MHDERINLLPLERQRMFRRDYFLRLGIVANVLFIMLVVTAAVLLIPTYLFLTKNVSTKETYLASIESTLSSGDNVALSAQLSTLSSDATTLTNLAHAPSVSKMLLAVLALPRPGISLSGFEYTPKAKASGADMLAVSGVAATRDALRNYQLALSSASFARSADLPVSAYAKDTDIAFTITITLAP